MAVRSLVDTEIPKAQAAEGPLPCDGQVKPASRGGDYRPSRRAWHRELLIERLRSTVVCLSREGEAHVGDPSRICVRFYLSDS